MTDHATTPPDAARRALRIGLTGPIGCGKSTVAGWLAERGARVIDADRVAREVVEPGRPAFDAVVAAFGPDVVGADGALDRTALAARVFEDPEALARLEAIVHPAVRPAILEQLRAAEEAGVPVVVIEAIKLVEGGLARICDEVWLVTCRPEEQRRRLLGRGVIPEDAERRIRTQGDLADRLAPSATRVLDTSGPEDVARERVVAGLEAALQARSDPEA